MNEFMIEKLRYWVQCFTKMRDQVGEKGLASYDAVVDDINEWIEIYDTATSLEKKVGSVEFEYFYDDEMYQA